MVRKSAPKVDGAYQDATLKPIPDPDTFGGRKQQEAQIAAVGNEAAETGGVPDVRNMPQPMNIAAPTNRVLEPITEGVPIGPGGNGAKPVPTDTVFNFLTVGYEMTRDPIFQELLIEHQNRNESPEDVGEGNAFGTILGA